MRVVQGVVSISFGSLLSVNDQGKRNYNDEIRSISLLLKTTEMRVVQGVVSISDGSLLSVNDQGKRNYNDEIRSIYVVLLIVLLINFRLHLNRQSEKIDKASCICLIVNVIFTKGCNFFGVKRIITPSASFDDVTLVEL